MRSERPQTLVLLSDISKSTPKAAPVHLGEPFRAEEPAMKFIWAGSQPPTRAWLGKYLGESSQACL